MHVQNFHPHQKSVDRNTPARFRQGRPLFHWDVGRRPVSDQPRCVGRTGVRVWSEPPSVAATKRQRAAHDQLGHSTPVLTRLRRSPNLVHHHCRIGPPRAHESVYLVGAGEVDARLSTQIARRYYAPIRCDIEVFRESLPDSDALVATSWETAYRVRTVGNTVRKCYFVQDLEHLFFPEGSLRELARETYRWGFFGITAGDWIADFLTREFGMRCVPFHFWYDAKLYYSRERQRARRKVLFYARPRTERRGFELGLLALGLVARQYPDLEVVMVGMTPSKINLPFRATYPGVLPAEKLPDLYAEATAALVLSLTNLSLIPLELMACGCPLVSNLGPNVEWMLSEKHCALADPRPDDLAAQMVQLLGDEEVRCGKVKAGLKFAARTSLAAEMDKVEQAFRAGSL